MEVSVPCFFRRAILMLRQSTHLKDGPLTGVIFCKLDRFIAIFQRKDTSDQLFPWKFILRIAHEARCGDEIFRAVVMRSFNCQTAANNLVWIHSKGRGREYGACKNQAATRAQLIQPQLCGICRTGQLEYQVNTALMGPLVQAFYRGLIPRNKSRIGSEFPATLV